MTDAQNDRDPQTGRDPQNDRDPQTARDGRARSAGRGKRIPIRIGLVLLGIILYTISMNMYSGYPEVGSQWINRAAIAALVVFAAVVFIRDERRQAREGTDDHHDDAH